MKKIAFLLLLVGSYVMASVPRVDIVFVLDTSGTMSDEATTLQNAIEDIKKELQNSTDFDAKITVLGIYPEYDYSCTVCQGTVKETIESEGKVSSIDQYEDWGPAIIDLSTKYTGWRKGAVKVIVPISDEGPENGDPSDQADDSIAQKAAVVSQQNHIYVMPVVGYGASSDVMRLAQIVAGPTSQVFTTTGNFNASDMIKAIKSIIAETTGSYVYLNNWEAKPFFNRTLGIRITNQSGAKYYELKIFDENGNVIIHKTFSRALYRVTLPANYTGKKLEVALRAVGEDSDGKKIFTDWQKKTLKFATITPANLSQIASSGDSTAIKTIQEELSANRNSYLNGVKFDLKPPTPKEIIEEQKMERDPVDVTTGNFAYHHTDLLVPTIGIPLMVQRLYNSVTNQWGFDLEPSLDLTNIYDIVVDWQNGNIDHMLKTDDGWASPYTSDHMVSKDGYFVVIKSDGREFYFDSNGRIAKVTDKKGNGYTYTYNGDNISLKDTLGNQLIEVGKQGGKIVSITDAMGNAIFYEWDGDKLLSCTDRNGEKFTYDYDGNGYMYKVTGPDGESYVENSYDGEGRVLSQKDGRGNTTTFEYDLLPNLDVAKTTTVTYPDGTSKVFENFLNLPENISRNGVEYLYEYNGTLPVKVTDPNGKSVNFTYNDQSELTEQRDPLGDAFHYRYDQEGRLVEVKNPKGHSISYLYDNHGNLIKITYPNGGVMTIDYNAQNQPIKITNPVGASVTYSYNERGLLKEKVYPNGAKIKYLYDANGKMTEMTDSTGRSVKYDYDKNSRLVKVTDSTGKSFKYSYNGYGDLIAISDDRNRTTRMEYNVDGLLTKLTLPDGRTFEKKYDPMGRVTEQIDNLGRSIKYEYDDFGRVSKVTDPKGNTFSYKYDKVGNLIGIEDAEGHETKIGYDELYRPSKFYDANGEEVYKTTYDSLSLPTSVEDAMGRSLQFKYDEMNHVVSTVLSDTIEANAVYDLSARLRELIDPKGYKTEYDYDQMGHIIKETNPLGLSTIYDYDLSGRLVKVSTPGGVESRMTYDGNEWLKAVQISTGKKVYDLNLSYDKYGRLIGIKDPNGSVSYSYDNNDRVQSRTDIFGNKIGYKYDAAERLSEMIYPDGKTVDYAYDVNGNLVKVTDVNGNVTKFEYDANSLLTRVVYPTGAYVEYTYDNNNRLVSVKNYDSKGNALTSTQLTRNVIGTISDIESVDYVPADRSKIPALDLNFNAFNQIVSSQEGEFRYDKDGHLLSFPLLGKHNTMKYGLNGRIAEANILGDEFIYHYDPEGNRVEVTKNGHTNRYLIDTLSRLPKPVARIDGENEIVEYYIYGPNGLLYSIDDSGHMKIYLYDYRGNTNLVIDDYDKVKAAYTYSAYGVTLGKYETFENPFRFLGKYGVMTDNDAQVYIRARYYNPYFARWNKADTLRGGVKSPLSLNRYIYVNCNPIAYIDVNGNWAGFDDLVAGLAGGVVGVIGQGASDLVSTVWDTTATSLKEGKFTFKGHISDWESYAGAFVGGAAAGETLLYTANPILAGMAAGASSSAVKQGLYALENKTTVDKAAYDIVSSTALGGITAAIPLPTPKIKLSSLTYSKAVNNSLISRLSTRVSINGIKKPLIKNLSKKTALKLGTTQVASMSEGLIYDSIFGSIKNYADDRINNLIDSELVTIQNGTSKRKAK